MERTPRLSIETQQSYRELLIIVYFFELLCGRNHQNGLSESESRYEILRRPEHAV